MSSQEQLGSKPCSLSSRTTGCQSHESIRDPAKFLSLGPKRLCREVFMHDIYALLKRWGLENQLQRPLRQLLLLWYWWALYVHLKRSQRTLNWRTLCMFLWWTLHIFWAPAHLPPLWSVPYHGYTIVYLEPGRGQNLETSNWKVIMPAVFEKKMLGYGENHQEIFRAFISN